MPGRLSFTFSFSNAVEADFFPSKRPTVEGARQPPAAPKSERAPWAGQSPPSITSEVMSLLPGLSAWTASPGALPET
jgi:hypothetical protein